MRLIDDDRDPIALRGTDAHRPGMAVRICTVRYVGRFLGEDSLAVPWELVGSSRPASLGRRAGCRATF
ncbi:hypothetical protein ACFCZY_19280 [Streptomyces sp. NPDC056237]|uniref:hypothetical protein n=1 Tax=unclassified Streptomyces TaxID=2593676 RepID=UPI0035DC3CAA